VKYQVARTDGTPIPADEPVFVVRAQDRFATDVLRHYRKMVLGVVDDGMIAELDRHLRIMTQWRNANPDRVKVPD
jgi:hypothetical protein